MSDSAIGFAPAEPVRPAQRLLALDAVRGLAVLGILLMNITAWGLHFAAYDNPAIAGGAEGADLWFWVISHLLFEGKMRALFSMLFGASALLLVTRLESSGAPAADIWYRRMLWLMLFGILHAYLLWFGEILYLYALCGLVLYPFRGLRARTLLFIGIGIALLSTAALVGRSFYLQALKQEASAAQAVQAQGRALTDDQAEALNDWEQQRAFFAPTSEEIAKDRAKWTGSVGDVFEVRANLVGEFHSMPFYGPGAWDAWAMMFLGMALLKLGVLSGERSAGFYLKLAAIGYAVGLGANAISAWGAVQNEWDVLRRGPFYATYDLGRTLVALAHAALLIWLVKRGVLRAFTRALAAVGQMAFSNYVMQSVLCSTIFYGYGLALYGSLQRHQLLYVFAGVTLVQVIFSLVWLRRYRMGPLEWAWRSLTYWKRQPLKLVPREATGPPPSPVPG